MSRFEKLLLKILRGTADANVAFDELCLVLRHLGFSERVKGGHHIFFREEIVEILNLQPRKDAKAKAYQVKQVRNLILKHGLGGSDDEGTA